LAVQGRVQNTNALTIKELEENQPVQDTVRSCSANYTNELKGSRSADVSRMLSRPNVTPFLAPKHLHVLWGFVVFTLNDRADLGKR